jgi:hypothetical protein
MAEPGAKDNELKPGPELLKAIRAGFVMRGTTLHAWCKKHDIHRANATNALLGGWRGPKGRAIGERIAKAAGIERVGWNQ